MGTSYLNLTNRVLRKINETELTDTGFSSAKGLQALAKDSVLDSISEICQQEWEWPFLATETTATLVTGQSEYSWPSNYKDANWDTFQIQNDGTHSNTAKVLETIDIDRWYKFLRDADVMSGSTGLNMPKYVFNGENGFGVSPRPNKPYVLKYKYWKTPTPMVLYSDTCEIPHDYDNVIVTGALYHMNIFKENVNGTNLAEKKFYDGIKSMRNSLLTRQDKMDDTVINFTGVPGKTTYGIVY